VATAVAYVRDLASLSRSLASASAIVHLAAVHRDDVRPLSLYDEVNVAGARNVCEAARRNAINRIVFTSSVAVYGFAPPGTDESGALGFFNDYGRTKAMAEEVFVDWQTEHKGRSLVIVRPTVIFGEGNRGNVYNLMRQIASGKFVTVGSGDAVKSMAYVENVASFLLHALGFGPGVSVYNYVDKPDLSMNELVDVVLQVVGRSNRFRPRLPYWLGYSAGLAIDGLAGLTGRTFPISAIRVRKFCTSTQFAADRIAAAGFKPGVSLREGLERTIRYEFLEDHRADRTYSTE
jgi:nucleoside-diphosphate-sugar epimerase